jgi:hypothetical protein
MTEKPTVALTSNEWRSLIVCNLQEGITFTNGNGQLTAEGVSSFSAHLDKIKTYLHAWHASNPPQAAQGEGAPQPQPEVPTPQANGAAPMKRRGGWPAGKPRKPKNEAAVQ